MAENNQLLKQVQDHQAEVDANGEDDDDDQLQEQIGEQGVEAEEGTEDMDTEAMLQAYQEQELELFKEGFSTADVEEEDEEDFDDPIEKMLEEERAEEAKKMELVKAKMKPWSYLTPPPSKDEHK